jgi:hypothetical protein
MSNTDDQPQPKAAASVFEFGTWRQVPVKTARQTTTQGRPPKKKGG